MMDTVSTVAVAAASAGFGFIGGCATLYCTGYMAGFYRGCRDLFGHGRFQSATTAATSFFKCGWANGQDDVDRDYESSFVSRLDAAIAADPSVAGYGGTVTGRFSGAAPDMQGLKRAPVAPWGATAPVAGLAGCDFSTLEDRVLACGLDHPADKSSRRVTTDQARDFRSRLFLGLSNSDTLESETAVVEAYRVSLEDFIRSHV